MSDFEVYIPFVFLPHLPSLPSRQPKIAPPPEGKGTTWRTRALSNDASKDSGSEEFERILGEEDGDGENNGGVDSSHEEDETHASLNTPRRLDLDVTRTTLATSTANSPGLRVEDALYKDAFERKERLEKILTWVEANALSQR